MEERGEDGVRDGCGMVRAVEEGGEDGVRGRCKGWRGRARVVEG